MQCSDCGRDVQDCICGRDAADREDAGTLEILSQSDTRIVVKSGEIEIAIDLHTYFAERAVTVRAYNKTESFGDIYASESGKE